MSAVKSVLVIQNDAKEGAGLLASILAASGVEVRHFFGWDLPPDIESINDASGLVILGGAQGAYETDEYPYLGTEMALVRHYSGLNKPVMGICLGAQIIAQALGGEVKPSDTKEIGWYDLEMCTGAARDALLSGYPDSRAAYHFHGDFIDALPGSEVLARSELTACQAFRFGQMVYGFQYHLEVDQQLIEVMCENNASYMCANDVEPAQVIADSKALIAEFECNNRLVLERWVALL